MISTQKTTCIRCEDDMELLEFSYYTTTGDCSFTIKDAYCGGSGYTGIWGRIKRAWKALIGKPIYYTEVYVLDANRAKGFLRKCINILTEEQ